MGAEPGEGAPPLGSPTKIAQVSRSIREVTFWAAENVIPLVGT